MAPMNSNRRVLARQTGFSMLEVMVVTVIIGLILVMTYPSFTHTIRKSRTRSYLEEVSNLLVQAKQEAVRQSVSVVVQPNPATQSLFAFANVDGDGALKYEPDSSEPYRTVDYEVFNHLANPAARIRFESPGTSGSTTHVDGLTAMDSGENAIVFEPDGSVRDVGALRLADPWGNFFEVRVGPAASGRISLTKYNDDPHWGDSAGFFPNGIDPDSGEPYWIWSTRAPASE